MQRDVVRVQYGCGHSAAPGWLNFDASPRVWLERLPVVGRILASGHGGFPREVRFGDIVTGLPLAPASVDAVYASHVLEHLSYDDVWAALRNTLAILRPGGAFRLIVPDLGARARRYLALAEQGDASASASFMRETYLGRETRPRSLIQRARAQLGNSDHLWMWDEAAMIDALRQVGFVGVRRCEMGDADDPGFAEVEAADRFRDPSTGDVEVAIEARRPLAD